MTFKLLLKDDTTSIDFLSAAYKLRDRGFDLWTPKKKQVWGGESVYSHGSQLVTSTFENRRLRMWFHVTGATRDELASRISAIENLLEKARQRSIEQTGSRVELQYQWDGSSGITYFEIIDGELRWPKDTMSVEQVHQTDESGNYIITDFYLTFVMAPFAYPISPVSGVPTELAISNGNESDKIGGLQVWNHDDAGSGHDNWVQIDGSDFAGDFEAKVKLILEADSGEAEKTSKIYIGVRKGDLTFRHILEDDDEEFVFGSPTPTTDADYSSGGTYTEITFADTDGEIDLIRWALTAAQVEATQGPFRFFGRCHEGDHWDQNGSYAIAIKYGTAILFQSGWVKPIDTTTELLDFGTIYLPPWLVGTPTGLADLKVSIRAKRDTVGNTTINLDYVALMPQDGGYRILEYRATGVAQFEETIDDGWEEIVYHVNTSGKKTGLPFGLMPRIVLRPGNDCKIFFLQEGTSQNCEITRQMDVQVFVVPTHNALV
jgi:hypothetical protein